jgi:hypothetical protein
MRSVTFSLFFHESYGIGIGFVDGGMNRGRRINAYGMEPAFGDGTISYDRDRLHSDTFGSTG